MKLTILLSFFLLTCSLVAQQPIAYYKFDNSAKDYSGNGNDGTVHGSVLPTMDRFGNHCGAYLFDGATGFIEVPTSASLEKPANDITITAWCRLNSKRNNYWLTIACKGATNHESPDNPQYRFQMQQDLLNSMPKCMINAAGGFATVSLNTAFTACDNQFTQHTFRPFEWCFYALVFSGKKVTVYANDQVIFEADHDKTLVKNSAPLYIGFDEPGSTEYFDGSLDDLYLFDQALDEQAIKKIYNEQRSTSWDKDELTFNTPSDKTEYIPANQTSVPVTFDPPKITNNGCGKVNVSQVWGRPSGTALAAGKHLIVYKVTSTSGYEAHIGFYITVKNKPGSTTPATPAPTPPPPTQKPVVTPTPVKPAPAPKDTQREKPQPPVPRNKSKLPDPPASTYRPADLDKRKTNKDPQLIEVNQTHLKLMMYDNGQYDGDTVSIFLNNKVVIARQEVTITGTAFYIDIDSTIDNTLLLYAENLGSIPPNTALMVLNDGGERHEVFLSSSLSQNSVIRIRKKKK